MLLASRVTISGSIGYLIELEGLSDQRRADCAGGVAAAQRDHASAKARRYGRRRQQIARKVDDIAQIIALAEPLYRVARHRTAIVVVQSDRAADARVLTAEHIYADASHALDHIRLDKAMRGIATGLGQVRADIERRMGPGRLRQIFYRDAHAAVAFDQQHVGGLQAGEQLLGPRSWRRAVDMGRLGQEARQQPA